MRCCAGLMSLCICEAFAVVEQRLPVLTAQGDTYANACDDQQQRSLQALVMSLAGGNQADEAWKLTHAMLCGEGKAAERFVMSHMPKRIASDMYPPVGDDGSTVSLIPRSTQFMRRKNAWGSSASTDMNFLTVSVMSGEASVSGFYMLFQGGHWWIVKVVEASD
jgi:hypothetical protein